MEEHPKMMKQNESKVARVQEGKRARVWESTLALS